MQTPQENVPELAKALGIPTLVLKREDLHPLGSHKGRSIPKMMEYYAAKGVRDFVISSSGNAAIAAAMSLPAGCTLKIFIGKNIDPEKRKKLAGADVVQMENPKQQSFQMEKDGRAKNLRQSTDDAALAGYQSLAEELQRIPRLQAVFIPTSSGTTAQALGQLLPGVQIHIVQTEAVHPMAEYFDQEFTRQSDSVARAIVDKVGHRKAAVIAAIKKSVGAGWIVSDVEIQDAMRLVKEKTGIGVSPNSALSIAGLKKAVSRGWAFSGAVACILTGP